MLLLPPPNLQSSLSGAEFSRSLVRGLPELASCNPYEQSGNSPSSSRRAFLLTATLALTSFGASAQKKSAEPLVFSPEDDIVQEAPPSSGPNSAVPEAPLKLGEIPADFWLRPRELWLRRQQTGESLKLVYWRDGKIVPEAYWQICALMRDVKAHRMTSMDPVILDVLRGILGFYSAWNYQQPLTITSGFRTAQTNASLIQQEGAAKNSMHLYGRAIDVFMTGIAAKDIASLGVHLNKGGVGFYPSKGFTHLDTGRLRVWRG